MLFLLDNKLTSHRSALDSFGRKPIEILGDEPEEGSLVSGEYVNREAA